MRAISSGMGGSSDDIGGIAKGARQRSKAAPVFIYALRAPVSIERRRGLHLIICLFWTASESKFMLRITDSWDESEE